MSSDAADRDLPERIGQYRIVRLLGEGGMGAVYVAEQDNPRRPVALKVLRAELASREALKRFAYEAQVLARLQHPGIAQIHEAGTFESARGTRPFFAMELIEGARLDEFVESRELALRERIELLAKICDAVEHAHQRGVIHRDLKPGNILVDANGSPKILDFGVARATDADVQLTTLRTEVGQILGTLAYMSPEQVTGDPDEIDTRSDVYALGVIAFQLLSGALPYEVRGLPVWEAARVIRTVEPTKLSHSSKLLRGDLETVVGKALEKDKTRRYGSASDLAADLRRYVSHEPISARPPSALYQLQKFSARNRALVGGVCAVFAAVVIGLVVSLRLYFQAEHARDVAQHEQAESEKAAARANAVNQFLLQRMLAAAAPMSRGANVRVVDVLDQAAAEVASSFAGQRDLEGEVRSTLGHCYAQLERFDAAEPQLIAALAISREVNGEDAAETLRTRCWLGKVYVGTDRIDDALAFQAETVERMTRVLGPEHAYTLEAQADLATACDRQGDFPRAVEIQRRVLAVRERVLGAEARETLSSKLALVNELMRLGTAAEEAQSLAAGALEASLRELGANDAVTINARSLAAQLASDRFEFDFAARELSAALAATIAVYGADHPETAVVENSLGGVYDAQHKTSEAERAYRHAREVLRAKLGDTHQFTMVATSNLAGALMRMDQLDEAEALQRENLAARRSALGDHPDVAESLDVLGQIYVRRKVARMALPYLDEALAIDERRLGGSSEHVAAVLSHFIDAYEQLGDRDQSEACMRRLLAVDLELYGEANEFVMGDRRRLAQSLVATERAGEAEVVLCPSLEVLERVYPDNARVRSMFPRVYATCFAGQGRRAEAERWLLVACGAAEQGAQPDAHQAQLARESLAQLYDEWERPDDAARVRERLAQPVDASAPRSGAR